MLARAVTRGAGGGARRRRAGARSGAAHGTLGALRSGARGRRRAGSRGPQVRGLRGECASVLPRSASRRDRGCCVLRGLRGRGLRAGRGVRAGPHCLSGAGRRGGGCRSSRRTGEGSGVCRGVPCVHLGGCNLCARGAQRVAAEGEPVRAGGEGGLLSGVPCGGKQEGALGAAQVSVPRGVRWPGRRR